MQNPINVSGLSRRKFLKVSGAGVVTASTIGSGLWLPGAASAEPYAGKHTWISPRGTIEVMDDYAIWVAQAMGYFGDLGVELELQPGPPGRRVRIPATRRHTMNRQRFLTTLLSAAALAWAAPVAAQGAPDTLTVTR